MSSLVQTKIFWKSYFIIYDQLCKVEPYKRLMQASVAKLKTKAGDRILDVGCGTGNLHPYLRKASSSEIVMLDNSQLALSRAAKKSLGDASLLKADLDAPLPFCDACFDSIASVNVFYLLKDPLISFREIYRILKPGSSFVMSGPREKASPFRIFIDHIQEKHRSFAGHFGSAASVFLDLKELIKGAGVFMLFLPFQLLLKSGKTNFRNKEFWVDIAEQAGFQCQNVSPAYADTNYIYLFTKPEN